MNISELLEEKRKNNSLLRQNYFSQSKTKAIWAIFISDEKIIKALIPWLEVLQTSFLIISDKNLETSSKNVAVVKKIPKDLEIWLDFIVTDNNTDNLKEFIHNWVCPIVQANNYLLAILEEFNPLKVSGNSFVFKNDNEWDIFYAIVRYLENFKFPYDNRNLIKNLLEI